MTLRRTGPPQRKTPLTSSKPLSRSTPLPRTGPRTTCSVDGCDSPRRTRELCNKHYARWLRHGDTGHVGRPGLREEVRFAKATRRGEPSDYRPDLGPCLIYTGADNGNGYGQFRYNGRNGYAHRYAWEREHGAIADDLTVDHLCRVRRCVEVAHLELVDAVTNFLRGVAAWDTCRSGEHPRTPENIYTSPAGRRYCRLCRKQSHAAQLARRRKPADSADPRVRYDQKLVRAQIAEVRRGDLTIAAAARAIGCNPGYLGRRIWREARQDVLKRDGHQCLTCGKPGELDVHHRRGRGSGGTSDSVIAYGFANLMSLCRPCHLHVTTNPAAARQQGWAVLSTDDPADVPVWLAGRGFTYLRADGSTSPEQKEAA